MYFIAALMAALQIDDIQDASIFAFNLSVALQMGQILSEANFEQRPAALPVIKVARLLTTQILCCWLFVMWPAYTL